MKCKKIVETAKKNKLVLFVSTLALLFLFLYLYNNSSVKIQRDLGYYDSFYHPEAGYDSPYYSEGSYESFSPDQGSVKVKQGSMSIKSKEINSDFDRIKELVTEKNGYVEEESRTETESYIYLFSVLRVPLENFDQLAQEIQDFTDVWDYQAHDYRINIQYQVDELAIIEKALADYAKVRQDILLLKASKDQIELLVSLTEKELNLVSRQKMFQRDLMEKKEMSQTATLTVSLEQEVPVKIWPENLGNRFREKMGQAISSVSMVLVSIFGNILILIVKILEYLVYLIILFVPALLAWRWGQKFYKQS
jgi:hypothetical protein